MDRMFVYGLKLKSECVYVCARQHKRQADKSNEPVAALPSVVGRLMEGAFASVVLFVGERSTTLHAIFLDVTH